MSFLKSALTILLAGIVGLLLLRLLARWMIYPRPAVQLPTEGELDLLSPHARLVRYESADGVSLAGIRVPPPGPTIAALLYFHGNAESAAQNLPFAEELAEEGIDTLLAEYRGYSGLPGRPTEMGLNADAEAALHALRPPGDGPPLVLAGRSLGTGVAVQLASRQPPRLLVLISPYTSLVDMGRSLVGPLAPALVPDRFDNLSKIAAVTCPVVIIHGTEDEVVPFRMGRRLAAAGRSVRLIPVEGRGHNDLPDLGRLFVEEIRRVSTAAR